MPRPVSMSIPQRAVPVLRWLADLPERDFQLLLSKLSDADTARSRSEVVDRLEQALPDDDSDRAGELITEIFNLLMLHHSHFWSVEEIAREAATSPLLKLDSEARSALEIRLSAIASNQALIVLSKAYDLTGEHQYLMHESRMMNDIRPIREDGPNGAIVGAIITHILKIEYHALRGREEIYIALTDEDLDELGDVIVRAKEESQALEAFIKSANIQDLSASME